MSAPSRDGMGSSPPSSTRRQFSEDKSNVRDFRTFWNPDWIFTAIKNWYVGMFRVLGTRWTTHPGLPSTTQGDSTADSSSLTLLVTIVETPTRKVKVSVFHDVSARYFAKKSFPSSIGTSPGKSAAMML
ncbi:Delta-aminolevulinic acid dehydratase [Frankliniella fusca]|uniref:Delta-aminolevulinic acid dehydratase n=1 Tax=Frankliniella fusca TaxID=407009 RepID=A0AAE1H7A8_9NEOP|nr:Delta-aminolevulinic acid dehydratase [Frankliniella fusca]